MVDQFCMDNLFDVLIEISKELVMNEDLKTFHTCILFDIFYWSAYKNGFKQGIWYYFKQYSQHEKILKKIKITTQMLEC